MKKIFMARSEVAKLLSVTPRTVGEIKGLVPIKINSRLFRYRVEDVELLLGVKINEKDN
tara:strand:+ start:1078 stop:1254 length:177 start_codon:yes stop_codon:yes gene_type:complete